MTEDTTQFVRELNELQRKHGLAIGSDHSGTIVYDPSESVPTGGRVEPIGYLIREDFDTGEFQTELRP